MEAEMETKLIKMININQLNLLVRNIKIIKKLFQYKSYHKLFISS